MNGLMLGCKIRDFYLFFFQNSQEIWKVIWQCFLPTDV